MARRRVYLCIGGDNDGQMMPISLASKVGYQQFNLGRTDFTEFDHDAPSAVLVHRSVYRPKYPVRLFRNNPV